MFNRIFSLIFTALFVAVMYVPTHNSRHDNWDSSNFLILGIGFVILLLGSLIFNFKRLGNNWPHLLLPIFYLVAVAGLYTTISSKTLQITYLIATAVLFYFLEMNLGAESHFLQNIYLFSVFAIFVDIFAIQFYFLLGFYWIILLVFAASYLLIIQGFAGFALPVKKYFSWLIALVCAQVAWGLLLWPTYFVVDAIITFLVFYLLWIFSFSAFLGKLTKNKIFLQLSLAFFVLLLTLVTASFNPILK